MPRNLIDKSQWGGAEKFDALLADIRARRAEFEKQRYITQDVIDIFKEIGIYRAFVPKQFKGDEKTPCEFLQAIEAISAADGSAGWVASFGMNPFYLSALPVETIKEVWRDTPDIVFAGGIFPPQPASTVEGGYKVKGRWAFASGCMSASLLGAGIKTDEKNALPRMAVMPREKVTIEKTWDVHGLTATGSFDLVVENVIVPKEWTFTRGAKSNLDFPAFKYPALAFAAQVLAVTTLGIAREAIDIVLAMGGARVSVTGAPDIGERPYVQMELAQAEAQLRSVRAFFYEATEDIWETIMKGDEPSPEQTNMVRLATTYLTRECTNATRTAYHLPGMTSVYYDHPLSRCFRDAHVARQHAFMGDITYQNAGAMMFGHQPLPGYL